MSEEIEVSFLYNDDFISKLDSIGAKLMKTVSLEDSYYEVNDGSCFLTLNDFWLRTRQCNGFKCWQLKYPIKSVNNLCRTHSVKQYYEEEDESKICDKLIDLALQHGKEKYKFDKLDTLAGLLKFSTIGTKRFIYIYEDFEIDLDEADFGYKVGEIEFKSEKSCTLEEKVQQVNELASKLGENYNIKKS